MSSYVLLVNKGSCKAIRSLLEARGLYDKQRKIVADGDTAAIPLTISSEDELAQLATSDEQVARCVEQFVVKQQDAPSSSSSRASAAQPRQRLKHVLDTFLSYRSAKLEQTEHEGNTLEDLKTQIPQRWEKYGDLVLLPEGAFSSPRWQRVIGDETTLFWNVVAEALDVVRLGILHPIADNGIREARVALVLGSHGVVQHVDNGIVYSWDVTRCMYSSGNITEKIRIAGFDCSNEVVVDLFAGIGYFTLPYLKHANAKHVYACEWNPEAIKALKNNLTLNKVDDRCTVIEGDNRLGAPRGVADRVNLGLIPTSRGSWLVALRALKPEGGLLHIHENVTCPCHEEQSSLQTFGNEICKELEELASSINVTWRAKVLHIERVKSYAPRIFHTVYDIQIR